MAKKASGRRRSTKATPRGAAPAAGTADGGPDASPPADGSDRSRRALQFEHLHVWQIQAVRDLLLVAAGVGLFWMGYALRAVTIPLLVALLLAYLFEPLVQRWTRSGRLSRPWAVGALLGGLSLVVLVLAIGLLPVVIGQSQRFVGDVREGRLRSRIASLEPYVPDAYGEYFILIIEQLPGGDRLVPAGPAEAAEEALGEADDPQPASGDADDAPMESDDAASESGAAGLDARIARIVDERLAARADPAAGGDTNWLGLAGGTVRAIIGVVGSIIQVGLLLFLIPFYFYFFSVWYPDVLAFGRDLIPKRNRENTLVLLGHMDQVVAGFVRGRIVISLIMGVMLALGWLICDVPYAVPLGLLVGIFCAVPYLGVIGIPLACGFAFFAWLDERDAALWAVLLWPVVVFGIVQLIEGYVLTPAIAGKATNLDPVTILVVVLAGGSVMGVYGMLLAIPVAACGKILVLEVLMPRIHAWLRGEIADPLPIERD